MKRWLFDSRFTLACSAVLLTIAVSGCSDNMAEVHGRVTYNGKPVDNGTISFEAVDGKGPTSGGPIKEGQYELDGPARMIPGPKLVRIKGFGKSGKKTSPFPGAKEQVDVIEQYIPSSYNEKSTLKTEVKPGSNELDFALKKPS